MNPTLMIRGTWSYRSTLSDRNAARCLNDDTGTGRTGAAGGVVSFLREFAWAGRASQFTSDR